MTGPYFVAIEGPIGVGKTTLAQRLAKDLQAALILEEPDENPFLERFYLQPREYALSTQLFFLMQRAKQLSDLRQTDLFDQVHVSDFLIDKDRLFAQLTLDGDEYRLYEQIYRHVIAEIRDPDIVVYLQAPVTVLLERIAARGIKYEQTIDEKYLELLADGYRRHFQSYERGALVVVDAAEFDLVHNDGHYNELVQWIIGPTSDRHYIGSAKL